MRIIGKPYVPGSGCGRLEYWWQNHTDLSEHIVILRDITSAEMLDLTIRRPAGVIIVGHRYFSHIFIYLFTQAIPAVMVSRDNSLVEGDWCFLDGASGKIECSRSAIGLRSIQAEVSGIVDQLPEISLINGMVKTLDGQDVIIEASVSDAEGALRASKAGVAAIGLVRSEFLGIEGKGPPTKDGYIRAAQEIFDATDILPVSWRLLDIGGEKLFQWMRPTAAFRDSLGIRGCRAYGIPLVQSVIQAQLQALIAINAQSRCSLLIPYVSSLAEFQRVRSDLQAELGTNQFSFGAMLETPGACLQAPNIAQSADLVAIGTNDLAQAFFGASRGYSEVEEYLDPYSPALVRFLSLLSDIQGDSIKALRICGQLPLLPHVLEYFIGLGFRRFSVEPLALPRIIHRCARTDAGKMRTICDQVVTQTGSEEAFRCLITSSDP